MDDFGIIIIIVISAFFLIVAGMIIYDYQHPLTEQQKFENCVNSMDNHTLILDNGYGCNNFNLEKKGWHLDGIQGNDGLFSNSYLVYKR